MSLWRQVTRGLSRAHPIGRRRPGGRRRGAALPRRSDGCARRGRTLSGGGPPRRAAGDGQRDGRQGTDARLLGGRTRSADIVGPTSALPHGCFARTLSSRLVVVLVIASGSGAVTTIFSAMNALLLRPVPGIADPARLVALQPMRRRRRRLAAGIRSRRYRRARATLAALDGVAAWGRVSLTIAAGGEGTAVMGNMVSGNYFDVLGVRPALGRFPAPDEETDSARTPVIVVSHAFWQTQLGARQFGHRADGHRQRPSLHGHRRGARRTFSGIYTGIQCRRVGALMMQPLLRPRSDLDELVLALAVRPARGTAEAACQQELSALITARGQETGPGDGRGIQRRPRMSRPSAACPDGEGGRC